MRCYVLFVGTSSFPGLLLLLSKFSDHSQTQSAILRIFNTLLSAKYFADKVSHLRPREFSEPYVESAFTHFTGCDELTTIKF
jgi:hypothetical protein